jgi:hypothetical protein
VPDDLPFAIKKTRALDLKLLFFHFPSIRLLVSPIDTLELTKEEGITSLQQRAGEFEDYP